MQEEDCAQDECDEPCGAKNEPRGVYLHVLLSKRCGEGPEAVLIGTHGLLELVDFRALGPRPAGWAASLIN